MINSPLQLLHYAHIDTGIWTKIEEIQAIQSGLAIV